jgi:sugar diacid utilization regulator
MGLELRPDDRSSRFWGTLQDLVDALGPALLTVVTAPGGLHTGVADVVLNDPHEPPAEHQIVLGVGVDPERDAVALLRTLGELGVAGVVLKSDVPLAADIAAAGDASGIAIMTVPNAASWVRLVLLMRSVLLRGNLALPSEAFGGVATGDLFTFANAIAEMVDAPVTIEDQHSGVLAFSGRQDEADEARKDAILGGRVSERWLGELRRRGVFRRLGAEPGPLYVEAPGLKPRVAIAVRAGGQVLGSIWAVVDKPLSPDRQAALRQAASHVAIHLLRHRISHDVHRKFQSQLVAAVLEGDALASDAATRLHLEGDAFSVLSIRLPGQDQSDAGVVLEGAWDVWERHLAVLGRRSSAAVYSGSLYAVLPIRPLLDSSLAATRQLADSYAVRASESLRGVVRVGIGRIVRSLADIPLSRGEADRALDAVTTLTTDEASRSVVTLGDVRTRAMLLRMWRIVQDDPLASSGPVAKLTAYDREHGTAFLQTLKMYLDSFGAVESIAKELRIHPNTVRYRLRHMQRVGEFDLREAEERLLVALEVSLPVLTHPQGSAAAVAP